MNPASGTTATTQIDVRVDRNLRVPGRVWCAERPKALIAITHGTGEHSGRYAALADALVARRYTVVALDLPGNGEAPGGRGDVRSWTYVRDHVVPAMFTAPRGMPGQPPDLPAVLLGHGMGGVLALDYAIAHPRTLLAAIASAPALKIPPVPRLKLTLAKIALWVAPGAGFPNGIDETAISRDREVIEARRRDPLVHDQVTPRLYFQYHEARLRVMAQARRLSVPTLLLQGGADRVVDPTGALEFNVVAPHGMTRLVSYHDAYHELFNDLDRERVIKDVGDWLDTVVVV
ncbi:MAG TPA: alpha/beta hydrolase [Candidatus Limnocylindria bacterium]|nr:alpha/beta hydrolase [Candidatus Limnocylindria bacterium]